jgi:hypothetical protein
LRTAFHQKNYKIESEHGVVEACAGNARRPHLSENLLSGEAGADAVAQCFAVNDLAFEVGFGGFDDGSHLLHGVGAGFGEGFGDSGVHFGVAGTGWEIRLENGEFLGLFVDEVLAIAFSKLVDGFFALLDERLQDLDGFGFVERVDFFGFLILDGGLDAAQDAEAEFIFGAHGVNQVFLDFFGDGHAFQYSRRKERKKTYTEDTEGTEFTEKN